MPVYDYICDETGETAEAFTDFLRDAPPIGHIREHEGKRFRRVPSLPVRTVAPSYVFTSVQVEDHHPHAPNTLKDGTFACESKTQASEFCKKTADEPYLSFNLEGRKRRSEYVAADQRLGQ
jgi:hypothetical protein